MCSSIQVFLLFSSCSVGDAILFFTCSFCVFVLVFTTIRKRWTSTTFLHCQRDCFYTEFVGCILLLWSCHSREWFLFFFLNTCCVDTEKKKMVKDCSEFPFKRNETGPHIMFYWSRLTTYITEETWLFKQIYFPVFVIVCSHVAIFKNASSTLTFL